VGNPNPFSSTKEKVRARCSEKGGETFLLDICDLENYEYKVDVMCSHACGRVGLFPKGTWFQLEGVNYDDLGLKDLALMDGGEIESTQLPIKMFFYFPPMET
jgi:hypothetical protein